MGMYLNLMKPYFNDRKKITEDGAHRYLDVLEEARKDDPILDSVIKGDMTYTSNVENLEKLLKKTKIKKKKVILAEGAKDMATYLADAFDMPYHNISNDDLDKKKNPTYKKYKDVGNEGHVIAALDTALCGLLCVLAPPLIPAFGTIAVFCGGMTGVSLALNTKKRYLKKQYKKTFATMYERSKDIDTIIKTAYSFEKDASRKQRISDGKDLSSVIGE